MRIHFRLKTAAGGLSLLAATSGFAAPQNLPVKDVSVPAWNIITDTLFNLTPQVAGKRNTFLMQQICDLARGDASQQEVNLRLSQNKIDLQKLGQTGYVGNLVLKSERSDRQLACAAYLATSLFLPTDMQAYIQKGKEPAPAQTSEAQTSSGWFSWASSKKENPPTAQTMLINQAQLLHDAKIQMAVARATAQLYAVIAQNLPQNPSAAWATRQQQIADILREYAAEYLKSIDNFYSTDSKAVYTFDNITATGYSLHTASGNRLIKSGDGIEFYSRDVPWLSRGKIIGKDYFVDIAIIPAAAKTNVTKPAVAPPPRTATPVKKR